MTFLSGRPACVFYVQIIDSRIKQSLMRHSSFPVIHKVGNVGIFVLLKFENKLNREISHFNFISKHYDKCKFALKLIWLIPVSNLFQLEVVQ